MTKPSDFSPAEALEVRKNGDVKESRRMQWTLRAVGVAILALGWVAVAIRDVGNVMFVVDTIVFLAMAAYAYTAAVASRSHAVNQEKRLRLRLLVHNMELESMSMRDELTQVFDRRYLFERLERELQSAKGFQRPLGFIAIEVKSLGHLNRTYSYTVGDQILAAFGQFLMDCTRATDIPARLSGSKFAVILPDTAKRGVYTMIERLTQALASARLTEDSGLDAAVVTAFGVSGYPWCGETVDGIVRQAEAELATQGAASDPDLAAHEVPAVFQRSSDDILDPDLRA